MLGGGTVIIFNANRSRRRTNTDTKWRRSPTRKSVRHRYPIGRFAFNFQVMKPRRLRLSAAGNNREADVRRADFSLPREARYVGHYWILQRHSGAMARLLGPHGTRFDGLGLVRFRLARHRSYDCLVDCRAGGRHRPR